MSPETAIPNTLETVPKDWPGAFGIYKYSKQAVLTNWGTLLGLVLSSMVLSGIVSNLGDKKHTMLYTIGQLLSLVVAAYASAATTIVALKSVRREKIGFSDALSKATEYFWPILGATLLLYVILAASILLFIIPFFFIAPRLTLTPYFLIDNKLGPVDALKASWEETRGHSGKIWGLVGVNIVYTLLFFTIIGIPFGAYFLFLYMAASALLYYWIRSTKPAVSK